MKINPNKLKLRNYYQLAIIKAGSKGGAHKDKKKEFSKQNCRKKPKKEE